MKRLLNVMYVSDPDIYLSLNGNNVVLLRDGEELGKVPMLNIESICTFGHKGVSPALMATCLEKNINLTFFSSSGRFRGRLTGTINGNVILRKKQYEISTSEDESTLISRHMIVGKIYNAEQNIKRVLRDHYVRVNVERLEQIVERLKKSRKLAIATTNLDELRGIEGNAASAYFSVFDECILQQKEDFFYKGRSKRPPLDRVNALLSLAYSLLATETAAALEGVGLDAYVGFLHRDRPGRTSLALDVMEELRPVIAERFVLKIINRKQIQVNDFVIKEDGAVLLKDDARKKFFKLWQLAKQDIVTHPYLKEKIQWGLVPHAQALLLARFLRGDLDAYPPFLIR